MILEKLIQNLGSQVEMHQVLLEALTQEKEIPASCNLLELEEVQAVRDFAVKQIFETEAARIEILEAYKKENGIDEDISLKILIKRCKSPHREQLNELRYQLNQLVLRIKSVGKQNAEKAVARISCFREVQDSIHKAFNRHSIYSINGRMTQPKGALMVQKSI